MEKLIAYKHDEFEVIKLQTHCVRLALEIQISDWLAKSLRSKSVALLAFPKNGRFPENNNEKKPEDTAIHGYLSIHFKQDPETSENS